ncbi:MAG: hypothetical protein KDE00_13985 [Rhodobacteraceae bacterium]|nr:hypothetical protein [Paracoccaceae bacterium]
MRKRPIEGRADVGIPAACVVAWQLRRLDETTIARWTEGTMRRLETPSAVDLAKRPDTLARLSRLFEA